MLSCSDTGTHTPTPQTLHRGRPNATKRIPDDQNQNTITAQNTCYAHGRRFFVYWLILFLVHNMAICLFRAIGALSRDLVVANAVGSLALLAIMMMGGFVIPKASVHPWVVWLYWIDPLQYAQRALIINEFTAPRWARGNPELGATMLTIRSFPDHYWYAPAGPAVLLLAPHLLHL